MPPLGLCRGSATAPPTPEAPWLPRQAPPSLAFVALLEGPSASRQRSSSPGPRGRTTRMIHLRTSTFPWPAGATCWWHARSPASTSRHMEQESGCPTHLASGSCWSRSQATGRSPRRSGKHLAGSNSLGRPVVPVGQWFPPRLPARPALPHLSRSSTSSASSMATRRR